VPIILERPFVATAEAMIDVQAGTLSSQLCEEMVDFYFPPPTPFLKPANIPCPPVLRHNTPPTASPEIMVFDGN